MPWQWDRTRTGLGSTPEQDGDPNSPVLKMRRKGEAVSPEDADRRMHWLRLAREYGQEDDFRALMDDLRREGAESAPQPVEREALVRVLDEHHLRVGPSITCSCGRWTERPVGSILWEHNEFAQHQADAVLAVLAGREVAP